MIVLHQLTKLSTSDLHDFFVLNELLSPKKEVSSVIL